MDRRIADIIDIVAEYNKGNCFFSTMQQTIEKLMEEIKEEGVQEALDNGEVIAIDDTDSMLEVLRG